MKEEKETFGWSNKEPIFKSSIEWEYLLSTIDHFIERNGILKMQINFDKTKTDKISIWESVT